MTWPYSQEHDPSAPAVRVRLGDLELDLLLDTGFAGGIFLPFATFQDLGFDAELAPAPSSVVLPDRRTLSIRTTEREVAIGDTRFRTLIHSSRAVDRRLIGRKALASFVATLDGPAERLTIERSGRSKPP